MAPQQDADGPGNLGPDPNGEHMIAVSSVIETLVPQGLQTYRHPRGVEPAGQQVGLEHPPIGLSRLDRRRQPPGAEAESLLPLRMVLQHGAVQAGRRNALPGLPILLDLFRCP